MKKGFWIVVKDIIRKADVVLEVLDARMPELTRNRKLEKYAKFLGKKLIIVINKIDIVSNSTINNLKKRYSNQDYVFLSSKENKGIKNLVKLIKSRINKNKLRVAVIGYPNTGKSTLINRLSKKGRAKTSSESGFTKGMQYISGKNDILLIDTPGVVPYEDRKEILLGLTSAISPSKLKDPELVAYELVKIFEKNNPIEIEREYGAKADPNNFLLELGKEKNMLMKKGIVDERRAAIQFLVDWHKGKIKI